MCELWWFRLSFVGKIINILSTKLVVEILQIDRRDRYKATLIQYNTVVEVKDCKHVQIVRVELDEEKQQWNEGLNDENYCGTRFF